ncbi:uncharacterized protein BO80DRAFT_124968 [Aspergillus ibericus CBS 121593]|uniref:Uncharacterized protein n=1 Tax=Aspergillus ibericus CBS 121593 TaxID=1448316 RepID=A0A395GZM5_9EURO|nr:hypothetical protein BO80DRAFT_124968 [Aspergillus ibericus CBS 121593]RAK99483.1 hypothetical protein BO80DRAFT_124968 [Aspergillus ibericus CBS 121593]
MRDLSYRPLRKARLAVVSAGRMQRPGRMQRGSRGKGLWNANAGHGATTGGADAVRNLRHEKKKEKNKDPRKAGELALQPQADQVRRRGWWREGGRLGVSRKRADALHLKSEAWTNSHPSVSDAT